VASRFWVGGTGTWDNSTTTHWAASTGGAGGQSVPASADDVTFDANSGGGTVTVAATINGTNTIHSFTCGAFTGTLDFSANNPSITITRFFSCSGTGTRTINMGSGTFTINNDGQENGIDFGTITGLTYNCGTSTLVLGWSGSGAPQPPGINANLNNLTHYNLVFNGHPQTLGIGSASGVSCHDFTVNGPVTVLLPFNLGITINGTLTCNGTSTAPVWFAGNASGGTSTLTLTNNAGVATWTAFQAITFATHSMVATNSWDLGGNTLLTVSSNPTSTGGGGGGVIGT
jgi:hypothetical protein